MPYQLAFFRPGITPWCARFRKQIRQILNFRYTLRGRPQIWHRRWIRVENFGFLLDLARCALVAMIPLCSLRPVRSGAERHAQQGQ